MTSVNSRRLAHSTTVLCAGIFLICLYIAFFPNSTLLNRHVLAITPHPLPAAVQNSAYLLNWMGKTGVTIVVLATLSLWFLMRRAWASLGYLLLMSSVIVGSVLLFKLITNELRPFATSPAVLSSFPSGHTARAALLAGLIATLSNRHKWFFPLQLTLLYLLPIAVGLARVLLRAHWLTDVVASLALCLLAFIVLKPLYFTRVQRASGAQDYHFTVMCVGFVLAFLIT